MFFLFLCVQQTLSECITNASEIRFHFDLEYKVFKKCFTMINFELLKQLLSSW